MRFLPLTEVRDNPPLLCATPNLNHQKMLGQCRGRSGIHSHSHRSAIQVHGEEFEPLRHQHPRSRRSGSVTGVYGLSGQLVGKPEAWPHLSSHGTHHERGRQSSTIAEHTMATAPWGLDRRLTDRHGDITMQPSATQVMGKDSEEMGGVGKGESGPRLLTAQLLRCRTAAELCVCLSRNRKDISVISLCAATTHLAKMVTSAGRKAAAEGTPRGGSRKTKHISEGGRSPADAPAMNAACASASLGLIDAESALVRQPCTWGARE